MNHKAAYRADVDGLRALAVVSVIIYHLNNDFLPGGFVGVDIFFLISGYVVTSSVLRAETDDQVHDLLAFWRRRWLRILPALLVMVAITMCVAALLFAPIPLESYRGTYRTGSAAVLGIANLYLYRIGLDYFQADQTINVFSHTWSLGVEEQFYLCFSLAIIGFARIFRAGQASVQLRRSIIVVLGVYSFVAFLRGATRDPVATYYFLPPRLWELALGCSIALWQPAHNPGKRRNVLLTWIQLGSIATIVVCLFTDARPSFPLWQIISGVGAAALIVICGSDGLPLVSRLLSQRPIVAIGLISYSLYLWHWPVFVFFRYTVGLSSFPTIIAALAFVAILGYLSYSSVENRWRRSKKPFLTALLPLFAMSVALIIGIQFLVVRFPGVAYAGQRQNWNSDWLPGVAFNYTSSGRVNLLDCLMHVGGTVPINAPPQCSDDRKGLRRLYLVGDSHAFADWGMVAYGSDSGDYSLSTFVHDGCTPVMPSERKAPSCVSYWRWTKAQAAHLQSGDILFASFLWGADSASNAEARAQIATLAAATTTVGATLIVEAPLPTYSRPAYACIPEWFRTDYFGCALSMEEFEIARAEAMRELDALVKLHRNLRIWDPSSLICRQQCRQFDRTRPLFRDASHLSYYGSKSLGPHFVKFVRQLATRMPVGS